MKKLILAATFLGLATVAAPAMAHQDRDHPAGWQDRDHRGDQDRHDMDRDRHDRDRDNWRGHDDRGRHNGWRSHDDRGRHYGWRNHHRQHCRTIWRHHHRERVCSWR